MKSLCVCVEAEIRIGRRPVSQSKFWLTVLYTSTFVLNNKYSLISSCFICKNKTISGEKSADWCTTGEKSFLFKEQDHLVITYGALSFIVLNLWSNFSYLFSVFYFSSTFWLLTSCVTLAALRIISSCT